MEFETNDRTYENIIQLKDMHNGESEYDSKFDNFYGFEMKIII